MVNTPGAQATLRNFKASAFAQQNMAGRHTHVLEIHFHVAVRCIVIAQHLQRAHHTHAGCVSRHQHHALLRMLGGIGIALAHDDVDGAAWVARARNPPLVAIDHVLITLALNTGADIGGVARCHLRLGHRKGGADLAIEQRLEPTVTVLLRTIAGNGFHIARIRCRAVEHFGGPAYTAHDFSQRCVFLIRQACTLHPCNLGGVLRQKQVPQALLLGLVLQAFNQLQGRPALARLGIGFQLLLKGFLIRVDVRIHETQQARLQFLGLGGVIKIHGSLLS